MRGKEKGESAVTRDEAFEFLDRTARGIAEMFGGSCETLVHDFSVPTHPILSIYNSHVSGRAVGSTQDILGTTKAVDEESSTTDLVNLFASTPSGQQIKSSTFHLIGPDYNLALGINFDYTSLVYANRILVDLMSADADLQSALWHGGDAALADVFDECAAAVGKPGRRHGETWLAEGGGSGRVRRGTGASGARRKKKARVRVGFIREFRGRG